MKTIIYIIILSLFFSSCKQTTFLTRKYTAGRFVEGKKTLKHNTVFSDTLKYCAAINNKITIKGFNADAIEKEFIANKIKSISVKKDTIIHLKKRGPDKEIVIKSNSPDVHVFVNSNKNNHKQVESKEWGVIEKKHVQPTELKTIKTTTTLALIFSIIPIVGFIFSVKALALIKKYKKANPNEKLIKEENKSSVGLAISIIPSLLAVVLLFLVFTALFLFVFSATPVVPAI